MDEKFYCFGDEVSDFRRPRKEILFAITPWGQSGEAFSIRLSGRLAIRSYDPVTHIYHGGDVQSVRKEFEAKVRNMRSQGADIIRRFLPPGGLPKGFVGDQPFEVPDHREEKQKFYSREVINRPPPASDVVIRVLDPQIPVVINFIFLIVAFPHRPKIYNRRRGFSNKRLAIEPPASPKNTTP